MVTRVSVNETGDSHKYSQAAGPYWLAESIKVALITSGYFSFPKGRKMCKVVLTSGLAMRPAALMAVRKQLGDHAHEGHPSSFGAWAEISYSDRTQQEAS